MLTIEQRDAILEYFERWHDGYWSRLEFVEFIIAMSKPKELPEVMDLVKECPLFLQNIDDD